MSNTTLYEAVSVDVKPEKRSEKKGGQQVGINIQHYHEAVVIIPNEFYNDITIAGYNFRTGRWYVDYNVRTTDTTNATDITDKITHYLRPLAVESAPTDQEYDTWYNSFLANGKSPLPFEVFEWMRDLMSKQIAQRDKRIAYLEDEHSRAEAMCTDLVMKYEVNAPANHDKEMELFAEWIIRMDICQVNAGYWTKNNPAFRDKKFAETTAQLLQMFRGREIT